MDGQNSDDSKQSTADMTVFVQNLLQQMVTLDDMGNRINELEQSINDLKAEMGVEGTSSPLDPSKQKSDEAKQDEGSA
ncbi:Heat shock factor-binding 1 [Gossypium arboreum]|uniref:Heat shock factor-binding 1 n=1 Tax=Gossypium arboreum TaxID=29729 RepID=A0A0B0P429_GOSAR|nr:Heat shock factor-binding 1 [Gossypium arboreum]